jgi:uncharacterized protein YndB with AHSA1/START domain
MSKSADFPVDPKFDLVFERVVEVPPELVFAAWTEPKHLVKWFAPAPWVTVSCEIDLRPGGRFNTVMRSPEGQEFPGQGCYLEVVKDRKLVWTDALVEGYRPSNGGMPFTGILTFEPEGKGTRYHVVARHLDEEGRKKHEAMGFQEGWGKALDQLVALMKKQG